MLPTPLSTVPTGAVRTVGNCICGTGTHSRGHASLRHAACAGMHVQCQSYCVICRYGRWNGSKLLSFLVALLQRMPIYGLVTHMHVSFCVQTLYRCTCSQYRTSYQFRTACCVVRSPMAPDPPPTLCPHPPPPTRQRPALPWPATPWSPPTATSQPASTRTAQAAQTE